MEVEIHKFDLDNLTWATTPIKVDFLINKEPIGTSGFRQAFEATSQTKGFNTMKWVVKKYLAKTIEDIQILQQAVESHTKKINCADAQSREEFCPGGGTPHKRRRGCSSGKFIFNPKR